MEQLNLQRLRNERPQNELHYWPALESTMTEGARLAAAGAPHNTVVLADEQTAGIGRLGRTWISERYLGLYMSVLLRLELAPSHLPVASLLVGLAVADAIENSTRLSCDLRWPNDVLINGKKAAGILPQLVEGCIVAGIGINVNNVHFPEGLRTPASSLLVEAGGIEQDREGVLMNVLASLDAFSQLLATEGITAILRAFEAASSYVHQRRVTVEQNGAEGVTAGLDDHGFLLLRTDDGRLERISSGGIRPA